MKQLIQLLSACLFCYSQILPSGTNFPVIELSRQEISTSPVLLEIAQYLPNNAEFDMPTLRSEPFNTYVRPLMRIIAEPSYTKNEKRSLLKEKILHYDNICGSVVFAEILHTLKQLEIPIKICPYPGCLATFTSAQGVTSHKHVCSNRPAHEKKPTKYFCENQNLGCTYSSARKHAVTKHSRFHCKFRNET